MTNNRTLVPLDKLRAGDILLCYKESKLDPVGKKITTVTDSAYTHAAICIDSMNAAESVVTSGVTKVPILALVSRYDHVAVFRQPDAWSATRIQALQLFIDTIVTSGAKYNLSGVGAFRKRKEMYDKTLTEQLHAFFSGELVPLPSLKGKYFCSELVADCFVAVGFIDPSAAIVYQSEITSPGDLGREPAFGTFYGYATCVADYQVPVTDEFFNATTFEEIFGKES